MLKLFHQRNQVFGLDISEVSLKLIELRKERGKTAVQAYSEINLPKAVVSGDKIIDPKTLIDTIKRAVAQPKFGSVTTSYVVASIPETKSFVRVIQMPMMSETEVKEAIAWEAEAYIPLPISQVYLDWIILGESGEDGKMKVLITASPREYIDDLVGVLQQAGLEPLILEVESQATARSLVAGSREAVLIADIDTVRTSLIIYDKGVLQFTSSVPMAGNALTESIARALNLTQDEAEKVKRQIGIAEEAGTQIDSRTENKIKKAMLPVLGGLAEEIKNTVRFYEEHSGADAKISRLLLSGGSSKLKHLPSFLHDKLTHEADLEHTLRSLPGMKVELGNPWVNILKGGEIPPMSREDSLSYSTAIGLALREFE